MTPAILILGLSITAYWTAFVSWEMATRPLMVCRYMIGTSVMITFSCLALTVWLCMLTSGAVAWRI
jgi:hypothetical protein